MDPSNLTPLGLLAEVSSQDPREVPAQALAAQQRPTQPQNTTRQEEFPFLELPKELRTMIFRHYFQSERMAIQTPLQCFLRPQESHSERNPHGHSLSRLAVCKLFYIEGRRAALEYCTFSLEGPSHLYSPNSFPIYAWIVAHFNLDFLMPPNTLNRLRNFQVDASQLPYLHGQVARCGGRIDSITLVTTASIQYGYMQMHRATTIRRGKLVTDDCVEWRYARVGSLEQSILLQSLIGIHTLRDVYVPFGVCSGCQRRGRFCAREILQAKVEYYVLDRLLKRAKERRDAEQAKALMYCRERKRRLWWDAAMAERRGKAQGEQSELEYDEQKFLIEMRDTMFF